MRPSRAGLRTFRSRGNKLNPSFFSDLPNGRALLPPVILLLLDHNASPLFHPHPHGSQRTGVGGGAVHKLVRGYQQARWSPGSFCEATKHKLFFFQFPAPPVHLSTAPHIKQYNRTSHSFLIVSPHPFVHPWPVTFLKGFKPLSPYTPHCSAGVVP